MRHGRSGVLRDGAVLFTRSAAHPNRSDDLTIDDDRNTAGKNKDPATTAERHTPELAIWPGILSQIARGRTKQDRRVRLVDGVLDTAELCTIHPDMSDEIATSVRHSNVTWRSDPFRRRDTRVDDLPSILKGKCGLCFHCLASLLSVADPSMRHVQGPGMALPVPPSSRWTTGLPCSALT